MLIHTKQWRTEEVADSYLKLHHHVVEAIITTTSHKATYVIFTYGLHSTVKQSLKQSQEYHQLKVLGEALHYIIKRD